MFAVFFTDAMDPFYLNVTSFPTVIFSAMLIFCIFFWLLAVIGVVDLDFLDVDVPNTDYSVNDGLSGAGLLGGLLMRFKLEGVPIPIVITLISLIGWFISYYTVHFLFPYIPDGVFRFLAGVPVFAGSMYLSVISTALIVKPLRPIFKGADQEVQKSIVGQVAIVRTSFVDTTFGEARLEDGGAGLIVKVRSYKEETFTSGDRVVLLEFNEEKHVYMVIAEKDFIKD